MDKYLKRKKIFISPKTPPTTAESPPPISTQKEENTPTNAKKAKQEELEVTGVSRSGRVRKKSSKLTDFESPDEIDPRYKRKADRHSIAAPEAETPPAPPQPKPRKSLPPPRKIPLQSPSESENEEDEEEETYTHGMKGEPDFDSDTEAAAAMMFSQTEEVVDDDDVASSDDSSIGATVNSEEEEIDDLDDDDEGNLVMVDDGPKPRQTNQAMSLYMMEKSTKKRLIVKDGKIVGRKKAQRKDKGKSRFTAYMLWAKEARKEILRSNPDMDFSTTSKRLGELWGIVPNSEKFMWRRRAKRMSVKQKADEQRAAALQASGRKFINKSSTPAKLPKMSSPPPRPESKKQDRRVSNHHQGQLGTLAAAAAVAQQQQQMQLLQQQQLQTALAAAANDVKSPTSSKPTTLAEAQAAGMFKAVGTTPVDVAAHLKLLGESLLIIGERLKEHEGQIAVSGSFSVLLDSLLCAMAPLLCLTQQVPELNGCSQETLSQTLDNIAYIMPGL